MLNEKHKWTVEDDLIAYCLYRIGCNEHTLGVEPKELGDILGMGFGSLNMKISNYKAIDGRGNLDGYTRQSIAVFNQYKGAPDHEVRAAAVDALAGALNRYSNKV